MNPTHIKVNAVNKIFKTADKEVVALRDINLEIPEGQFVCLLGPSGCGKSTLLNAIAGFSLPSSGSIIANGKTVTEPGPDRGMVFQEYALFPWMTVEQISLSDWKLKVWEKPISPHASANYSRCWVWPISNSAF
jgi:NitT/TauT family transport system ATP-binding protein